MPIPPSNGTVPPAATTRPEAQPAAGVLVHLASGIGNIVLAAPLLLALHRHGYAVDLLVEGDYPETAQLFSGWRALRAVYDGRGRQPPRSDYRFRVAALPPFYWQRFSRFYIGSRNSVPRPPDSLFYRNERAYYLEFARKLGCAVDEAADCLLPIEPHCGGGIGPATVVLAPGCKTGTMAAKRWPHFPELAAALADVVVVGTPDDLRQFDGSPMVFPAHARSLVGQLSLRETAGVMAAAGVVVANDSGIGHLAAAVGAPTILLFGPTPDATLGRFPAHVSILRSKLPCQPCWFSKPLAACGGALDCLRQLPVDAVAAAVLNAPARPAGTAAGAQT